MKLDDADEVGEEPIIRASFPPPKKDDTLYWDGSAEENFYAAFVVQVQERIDNTLKFKFVHKDTAEIRPRIHELDLRHANIVFRRTPSTVETASAGECGFLFLRAKEAPPLLQAGMADAGGGTGKYPRSAGLDEKIRLVAHRLITDASTVSNGPPAALVEIINQAQQALADIAREAMEGK